MFDELKQQLYFVWILLEVVAIWLLAGVGYYYVIVIAGIGDVYSYHPFGIAAYYLFWVALTLAAFRHFYKERERIEWHASMFVAIFLGVIGVAWYLLYILPQFPPVHWASEWEPPAELFYASPWYFLPKSIEIGLQQLLLAAMVLAFDMRKLPLNKIALWSAALFGGMHLLLVFNGSSLAYTAFFTASAVVAGFIFPYLMLRVRNGFIYSYFLHWGFYAAVIVLARLFFA